MKLDSIHIGVSPLTDLVYVGTVSKNDPGLWLNKVERTSDFCAALLAWVPPGQTRVIRSSAGPHYEITVREVPARTDDTDGDGGA